MSSTRTSSSFLSDFTLTSRRDRIHLDKKDLARQIRIDSLHHHNHSTHLRSVKHEEALLRTHRLHSLQAELDRLAEEKQKRREGKLLREMELKRLAREQAEKALREKIAKQEEKFVRKVIDLRPFVVEETEVESLPAEAPEEIEYSSSSSSEESPRNASPLPETVLVNRGGTMVQIHLIGKKVQRKKPLVRYTEEEAKSPDSPGLHWLRLWGMLKRKRKPVPSPPPLRHQVKSRMVNYAQRVKRDFSPTISPDKQLELQLRGDSDFLPKQFERVSLGLLSKTTNM